MLVEYQVIIANDRPHLEQLLHRAKTAAMTKPLLPPLTAVASCSTSTRRRFPSLETHLVDVLALELGNQLLSTLLLDLDATSLEEGGDVGSRRRGVSTELEEEVGGDVLHC